MRHVYFFSLANFFLGKYCWFYIIQIMLVHTEHNAIVCYTKQIGQRLICLARLICRYKPASIINKIGHGFAHLSAGLSAGGMSAPQFFYQNVSINATCIF